MVKKPNLFIVGAPKSGTTSMSVYLGQHPDIFFPKDVRKKEPYFFCTDFKSHKWRVESLEEYLNYFSNAKNEKYIGEGSVWYLYSKTAASEIKKFNPLSKIIIILRNPIDMMYSLFFQFLYTANENAKNFEVALDLIEDRKKGKNIPKYSHFPEGLFYKEVASYTEQVKRYLDTFGRENVHIIIFDNFVSETERAYKDTLEFLGVDVNFKADFKVYNPSRQPKNLYLWRFLAKRPLFVKNLSKTLFSDKFREEIINKKILDPLYSIFSRETKYPEMSKDTRDKLKREFRDEIIKLSDLIKIDLSNWL